MYHEGSIPLLKTLRGLLFLLCLKLHLFLFGKLRGRALLCCAALTRLGIVNSKSIAEKRFAMKMLKSLLRIRINGTNTSGVRNSKKSLAHKVIKPKPLQMVLSPVRM